MFKKFVVFTCLGLGLTGCVIPETDQAMLGLWVNTGGYPDKFLCITNNEVKGISYIVSPNGVDSSTDWGNGTISSILSGSNMVTLEYDFKRMGTDYYEDKIIYQTDTLHFSDDRKTMVATGGAIATWALGYKWLSSNCQSYKRWGKTFMQENN